MFSHPVNQIIDATKHTGLIVAFVVYDTLLKSDNYNHKWIYGEAASPANPTLKSELWHPYDEMKAISEIVASIKLKLLKQFPTIFVGPDGTNRIVDSSEIEDVDLVLDYTVTQLIIKMRGKPPTIMGKLLDEFYLYLLWISIQDIIDHNKQPSFANFRKYHLNEAECL